MDFQEYLAQTYFSEDALDAHEYGNFKELLHQVEQFIDVGASHGVYTKLALEAMEDGRIISIEADPTRFAVLENNIHEWAESYSITPELMMSAASDAKDIDTNSHILFYVTDTQISGSFFPVDERSDDYRPIEVPIIMIDQIADLDKKTLIKIDVEGAELRVLNGCTRLIEQHNSEFFVELSWWGDRERGSSPFSVLRFAWGHGMRVDRRLRSDYLLRKETNFVRRLISILKCCPPLLPRFIFTKFVPKPLRMTIIRRQNDRRLSRYQFDSSSLHGA